MLQSRRCHLCGSEITGEQQLSLLLTVRGEGTPRALAVSREICRACADPQTPSALATTIRRLPSILEP